jgi:hypothetical protein
MRAAAWIAIVCLGQLSQPPAASNAVSESTELRYARARLRAEVGKLQLQRGQTLVGTGLEAQLRWKSDLLDNQVQRLTEESRRTAPSIYYCPCWRW